MTTFPFSFLLIFEAGMSAREERFAFEFVFSSSGLESLITGWLMLSELSAPSIVRPPSVVVGSLSSYERWCTKRSGRL